MIKIAVNQNHTDKMPNLPPDQMKNWWRSFNGGFVNLNLPSVDYLIEAIQNGYSYTTHHRGYRKSENFIAGQHVGLDFDTGDERSRDIALMENGFIRNYASFIHTTASHTMARPRGRVIFILDRAIYSREKYSLLAEAFAEEFSTNGGADPSCKDPVRLFFGAKDCEVRRLGNVLTLEEAAEIVIPYKEKLRKRSEMFKTNGGGFHTTIGDASGLIHAMLENLSIAPDGRKWHHLGRVSLSMGGYVSAGYIDEGTAIGLLIQAIAPRAEDLDVAERRIQWGLQEGKKDPIYLPEDTDPLIRSLLS